jgi:cell division cycle 20-like protein 1 (cofactor of APC complex)
MIENRNAARDQNLRNDVASEKQIIMNNLIRSELLGQSSEFSLDSRFVDSQLKSPPRKEFNSSNNVFKFQSPQRGSFEDSNTGNILDSSSAASASGGRSSLLLNSPKKPVRKISKTPYKVLDAPSLQDDYYLNLVDWSHSNLLSVALGPSVYIWSAHTAKVITLEYLIVSVILMKCLSTGHQTVRLQQ